MLAAAACVLLIGTANLANLFLVRCLARQRETAVRTALGATRADIVRELSVEAGILGLGAGTLGIGIAVAGIPFLRDLAPSWVPRLSQAGVDARVVVFCALISIATVIIVGVTPAWQTSRGDVAGFLKDGGRSTPSRRQHAAQDGLVVLQVAVALVLLTGAGLLAESFARAERRPARHAASTKRAHGAGCAARPAVCDAGAAIRVCRAGRRTADGPTWDHERQRQLVGSGAGSRFHHV